MTKEMTNFDERLKKAIHPGASRASANARIAKQQALSHEQLKTLHGKYRLQLSEYIEKCLAKLPQHFPGFRFETTFGEKGWGAACSRDDLAPSKRGKAANFFSRLEVAVRPFSSLEVLELTAKATVRNKELFNRTHFELIKDADIDSFRELVDVWVLDYAELYAASDFA